MAGSCLQSVIPGQSESIKMKSLSDQQKRPSHLMVIYMLQMGMVRTISYNITAKVNTSGISGDITIQILTITFAMRTVLPLIQGKKINLFWSVHQGKKIVLRFSRWMENSLVRLKCP